MSGELTLASMARVRRTAEETRRLMVQAGMEMLQEHGVTLGLDQLTLEAACIEKDIARSSSHSAWAIDDKFSPQEKFQREVVRSWLFDREGTLFADAAATAVAELFADGARPEPRDIIRAGAQAALEEGMRPNEGGVGDFLSTDLALRHAIASQPVSERDAELLEWLSEGERSNRKARVEDTYKPFAKSIGYKPKASFGDDAYEIYSVLVASLVEGLSLRALLLPEHDFTGPIAGTENDRVPANVLGACLEALMPVFFERVDDNSEDS